MNNGNKPLKVAPSSPACFLLITTFVNDSSLTNWYHVCFGLILCEISCLGSEVSAILFQDHTRGRQQSFISLYLMYCASKHCKIKARWSHAGVLVQSPHPLREFDCSLEVKTMCHCSWKGVGKNHVRSSLFKRKRSSVPAALSVETT